MRAQLVALAVAVAFAPALASGQTFDALDLSGQELYDRYCSACHGAEARGDGPVAATLNKPVPNLRRLSANGVFPAAMIREAIDGRSMVIAHGTRQMPIWGYEFWVEEGADIMAERDAREIINRLVGFLASIQEDADRP